MARESSCIREEVVLKIGDEAASNEFDSLRQINDPSRTRGKEFSDAKNCRASEAGGGIQQSVDEDGEEDEDDDDLMCKSDGSSFQRHRTMFMSRTKSRLEDSPWRKVERKTNHKGKEYSHVLEEDAFGEFDWKDTSIAIFQWVSLLLILVALICTLAISDLKKRKLWELLMWKWEILILVLICGHLVSGWFIRVTVLLIEHHFIRRKIRVLYFVYGLRKSIQSFLWLGQVLLVWRFILAEEVLKVTKHGVVRYVTKNLICLWVATLIWLLKTVVVKALASSFHVRAFFERIREYLFKQYVIKKLLRPPRVEEESEVEEEEKREKKNTSISRRNVKRKGQSITIEWLQNLNHKNVSPLGMKKLMRVVQSGTLSTLDEELPSSTDEDEASLRIRDECEAKAAAKKIFRSVAQKGSKYIYLRDLKRFMSEDDALKAMLLLIGENEDLRINKKSLTKWMVDAFKERRDLALSLDDTKTAVDELHNILNVLVTIIIVIIWLFTFDIAISHFIVLVGSQILVMTFIFGDTCKRIFEAITFLFVMHPFDVGDRCEIDGVQMIVDEMNILTTVFLRYDQQKIIYPNSVLAMKPISNYFRSPDMADTVDFSIHISTPMEKISIMKERLISYIESRSDHWYQGPTVFTMEMEDMNRVKMLVTVKHRMNFQNMGERLARRTLLVEEMIKIFKDLQVEYRMLPLDMNVRYMPAVTSARLPSNWTTCSG